MSERSERIEMLIDDLHDQRDRLSALVEKRTAELERAERERDTAEDLLRRLRVRLEHATAAGVETWPEYRELREMVL